MLALPAALAKKAIQVGIFNGTDAKISKKSFDVGRCVTTQWKFASQSVNTCLQYATAHHIRRATEVCPAMRRAISQLSSATLRESAVSADDAAAFMFHNASAFRADMNFTGCRRHVLPQLGRCSCIPAACHRSSASRRAGSCILFLWLFQIGRASCRERV